MAAPFPTKEDLFDIGAREILARASLRPPGKRITAKAVYETGTNINSALAAAAAMGDEAIRNFAIRYGELFLDSAEDSAADRLISDHIDASLRRKEPSRAVVPLRFSRAIPPSDGAPYTIAYDRIFRTESGIEFRLLGDVYFPTNAAGPVFGEAEAKLAGSIGNVDARTITLAAQSLAGTGISLTNEEDAAGGGDKETTRDFVARAKLSRKAARGGTLEAIRLGALSVNGVKSAQVVEGTDSTGQPNGLIYLYIADVSGRANSLLVARVRTALLDYRGAGSAVVIMAGTPAYVSISYVVGFAADADQTACREQLRALTVSAVNQLEPGATLERSMFFAIARKVSGVIVPSSAVSVPSTDVAPGVAETIKTRADLVLVNGL